MAVDGNNHLFVSNGNLGSGTGTIGEYNATTGAAISVPFINGQGLSDPRELTLDANNHLFVANFFNATVGEYDAANGATINAQFVNDNQGLNNPEQVALDRVNNHLFVRDTDIGTVSEFDATNGSTIKFHFADGFSARALLADGHNHLFMSNVDTGAIVELDAITGAVLNPNFITGVSAYALALDGNNHLFVNNSTNSIGEYDATTGAAINANLINGLVNAHAITFVSAVPEPSAFVLAAFGLLGFAAWRWRKCETVRAGLQSALFAFTLATPNSQPGCRLRLGQQYIWPAWRWNDDQPQCSRAGQRTFERRDSRCGWQIF